MAAGRRQLARLAAQSGVLDACARPAAAAALQQTRPLGGGVPEFYGKKSEYTEGTTFLGTPRDHLQRVAKRPLSPDVFQIDGLKPHYKMPINAISSIMNRVTGVALSASATGAGAVALAGDLPAAIEAFKAAAPLLVLPAKAALAFPLVYHYAGGLRHIVWDRHTIGKQADKASLLENSAVDRSSWGILAGSAAASLGLAALSF